MSVLTERLYFNQNTWNVKQKHIMYLITTYELKYELNTECLFYYE